MTKKLSLFISAIMLMLISGCGGSDEPENPNGVYDWDIMERVYSVETKEIVSRNNYTLEDKTEAYVISLKEDFEKQSTRFYTYRFSYQKRK